MLLLLLYSVGGDSVRHGVPQSNLLSLSILMTVNT